MYTFVPNLFMKKISLVILLFAFNVNSKAQIFDTIFTKSIGGSSTECVGTSQLNNIGMAAASVAVDNSGNVYITCSTVSSNGYIASNAGGEDVFVVKLNSAGDTLWTKVLGGTDTERSYKIKYNSLTNSIYVVGQTMSNNGSFPISKGANDGFVAKISSDGNLIWVGQYGGSNLDVLYDLEFASDGNIVAVGDAVSDDGDLLDTGNGLAWVVWIDETTGEIQDSRTYLGPNAANPDFLESFSTITRLSDNSGFLLGGYTTPNALDFNFDNIFLAKISETGTLNFTKSIGSSARDGVAKILEAENNNFYVLGMIVGGGGDVTTYSGGNGDAWMVKCDATGNKIFDVSYGGTNWEFFTDATLDLDGNIIASAFSRSTNGTLASQTPNGGTDFWILKIAPDGSVINQKLLGGSENDFLLGLTIQNDFIYAVGRTESNNAFVYGNNGGRDLWLVKFGDITTSEKSSEITNNILMSPNPSNGTINFYGKDFNSNNYFLEVYDINGKNIKTSSINSNNTIDLSFLNSGLYYIKLFNNSHKQITSQKLVIQK